MNHLKYVGTSVQLPQAGSIMIYFLNVIAKVAVTALNGKLDEIS